MRFIFQLVQNNLIWQFVCGKYAANVQRPVKTVLPHALRTVTS